MILFKRLLLGFSYGLGIGAIVHALGSSLSLGYKGFLVAGGTIIILVSAFIQPIRVSDLASRLPLSVENDNGRRLARSETRIGLCKMIVDGRFCGLTHGLLAQSHPCFVATCHQPFSTALARDR